MPEQFLMDPTSEATGTQLDVSTDPYAVSAFSSPAPPLETATSGSIDTEGDAINARRHQNRQVSMTVEVTGTSQTNLDANVATLEAKVAKLALEGGTFRRVRTDATFRTLDILAADQYEKAFDVLYFIGNMAVCQINLLAEPYARGVEASVGTFSETTLPALTFVTPTITGDVPALGRLVVTEAQAVNQQWLTWGARSLTYTAGTVLAYQGESSLMSTGVTSQAVAGASGGAAATATSLSGTATGKLIDVNSTGSLALVGSYRVLARYRTGNGALLAGSATTTIELWATWQPLLNSAPVTNQKTTTSTGNWFIADLGIVTFQRVPVGTQAGRITLWATPGTADGIAIDNVWLEPTELSGDVAGGGNVIAALTASRTTEVRDSMVLVQTAASQYSVPFGYEGDYLKLRPGAVSEFIVKASRGFGPSGLSVTADSAIDDMSAQLFVTPRYLSLT